MGMPISNLHKFLCWYYTAIYCDADHLPQIKQANLNFMKLECDDFLNKQKDFSEVDSLFLLELKKVCDVYPQIGINIDYIIASPADTQKVILKLLPIDDSDPIYQKTVEAIGKNQKGGAAPDKNLCKLAACMEKYYPQISQEFITFKQAVYGELEERKRETAKELKKYGIEPGVDISDKELYDKKKIKKLIKNKLARELGIDPTDAQLQKPKELKKAIIKKLQEKISQAKNLEDVDKLCVQYTYITSGDLINAFLRNDLCLTEGDRPQQPASWGTDLHVDLPTFLDVATKALKLKHILYGQALDEQMVYRGLNFDKFLDSITKTTEERRQLWKAVCMEKKHTVLEGKIYQSKDITSTSADHRIALGHAIRSAQSPEAKISLGVIMGIRIKKGTAFGINFESTGLKGSSFSHEVILKPKQ